MRGKQRVIAVAGYYGMSNYGDDAFGYICSWGARTYWGAEKIRVLAPKIDRLPGEWFAVPALLATSFERNDILGRATRLVYKTVPVASASMIIQGGGSTLSSVRKNESKWLHGKLAEYGNKQLVGVGVSVGPFKSRVARLSVEKYLQQFSYLSVRDGASYANALKMSLPYEPVLAADLFGLFPQMYAPPTAPPRAEERPILGISMAQRGPGFVKRNQFIVEGLRRFSSARRVRIRIFILNSHPQTGDGGISSRLAKALQDVAEVEIVHRDIGVPAVWRSIATCRAFLSVRLHGAISAYMAGIPFALVEYHPKCTAFLKDVGQDDTRRLQLGLESSTRVIDVLERLWTGEGPEPRLKPAGYAHRAATNFTAFPGGGKD